MAVSDPERHELHVILTDRLGRRGTEILMGRLAETDSLQALVVAQGDQQRAALAEFREELRGDMADLREELRGETAQLRIDMSDRFRQQRVVLVGTMITLTGLVGATALVA